MPPDPGSPERWMVCARSDLALAVAARPAKDVLLKTLCSHAQKAAKKALKAVPIVHGTQLPKTHNLLLTLLPAGAWPPPEVSPTSWLSEYAIVRRSPDVAERTTAENSEKAVRVACAVVERARAAMAEQINRRGQT